MEYYFNELDPSAFQRLISALLVARFGEDARVTPLAGKDGSRDFETAPGNPYLSFELTSPPPKTSWSIAPRSGRYVFQAKFHRTTDAKLSDLRGRVLSDFSAELRDKIIPMHAAKPLNYFFLVTNVPSSADALAKVDILRNQLLSSIGNLHADIWWKDHLTVFLDLLPAVWPAFPTIFAGGRPPILADLIAQASGNLSRTLRLAIRHQYNRDKIVKFRQIDLAKELSRLFVDLDIDTDRPLLSSRVTVADFPSDSIDSVTGQPYLSHMARRTGALSALLNEAEPSLTKIILEGGPGQGKSTLTQMAAQVYRQQLLGDNGTYPDRCPRGPHKHRLPFRIELRQYAEQLAREPNLSIDKYLAAVTSTDAGGVDFDVAAIHDVVENSPVLLILDGLDEVGSDELRDLVLEKIGECVERFEKDLRVDLKVILTSRPPAIAGRQSKLPNYLRVPLAPMSAERVDAYLQRWLSVQLADEEERKRVRKSFESRRAEPHVEALIKNPMQLAVLLHFIYLKDDAFPSRRSDLYQEYFKIVIDRDVEKSPALRKEREIVEGLHRFLGFRIHALTEAQVADGSLSRETLLRQVGSWLEGRGDDGSKAYDLFKLGEERLGLIVTLRGEGNSAHYGFEVQPIREYFAAAHINESESNAHLLFEQMVRRPYWREVALFLAGLRRENEKADLVSRARQLDREPVLGWKQNGRDIILQLAKEGTLSQPRHVLRESVDFILDLLDPEVIPAPNDPKEFVPNVRKVLAIDGLDSHRKRLLSLLARYQNSGDIVLIDRLLSASAGIVKPADIDNWLLSHSSESVRLTARVRLHLPFAAGLHAGAPIHRPGFWEGVPDVEWARQWWLTGVEFWQAASLVPPRRLQEKLLERFAFEDSRLGDGRIPHATSNCFVAWRLLDLRNLIFSLLARRRESTPVSIESFLDSPVDYLGLSDAGEAAVRILVDSARDLLASTLDKGEFTPEAVSSYFKAIVKLIEEPGYIGLVSAQMLSPFVAAGNLPFDFVRAVSKEDIARVRQLYLFPKAASTSHLRLGRSPIQLLAIRLRKGEPPTPVRDLAVLAVGRELKEELAWIRNLPQPVSSIRYILDKCGVIKPEVLGRLSRLDFRSVAYRALKTSQLQRVLGIARRTDDSDVLAGCIIAVSGSKMLRLSGVSLMAKFLANRRRGVWFAGLLFRQYPNIHAAYPFATLAQEEFSILRDLSGVIASEPKRFRTGTVLAANAFRVDQFHHNLPPLADASGAISLPAEAG